MIIDDLDECFEVGTVLIIESAMNDEMGWDGPLRAIRPFTKREAADAYRAAWPKVSDSLGISDVPTASDFAPFLILHEFVQLMPERSTWFVGHDHFEP